MTKILENWTKPQIKLSLLCALKTM